MVWLKGRIVFRFFHYHFYKIKTRSLGKYMVHVPQTSSLLGRFHFSSLAPKPGKAGNAKTLESHLAQFLAFQDISTLIKSHPIWQLILQENDTSRNQLSNVQTIRKHSPIGYVQGDTSCCFLGSVDIKSKVAFYYKEQ